MAKADLLVWVKKHSPPLLPETVNQSSTSPLPSQKNDLDYFNDNVSSVATALACLRARQPPLSYTDIDEAMNEYNK